MNPQVKQLWVDALRSGDYSQGKGHLNKDGKFCCLGVLCDLAVKAGVDVVITDEDEESQHFVYQDADTFDELADTDEILTNNVANWAGMQACDPLVRVVLNGEPDPSLNHLSAVNDAGYSFVKIADLIEAQL